MFFIRSGSFAIYNHFYSVGGGRNFNYLIPKPSSLKCIKINLLI